MTKYYVTKTIHKRFTYYLMGVDSLFNPVWSGIVTNAMTYSQKTADEIAGNIYAKFPHYDIGIKPAKNNP